MTGLTNDLHQRASSGGTAARLLTCSSDALQLTEAAGLQERTRRVGNIVGGC